MKTESSARKVPLIDRKKESFNDYYHTSSAQHQKESKRQDSSLGQTSTDSARTEKKQSFVYEQQVKPKLELLKKKTAKSKQPSQTEFPAKLN